MESARFRHDHRQDQGGGADDEEESSGGPSWPEHELEVPCFLDIYVHHARNVHNICIYADQDVYAKFALTSTPDHAPALSTRVAAGGGASPSFHERLPPLRVRRGRLGVDVLKCEVWMRSCAKPMLEDQLLGFALVPLAAVAAAHGARVEQDLELSSTDLLHSPAGTVRLSLALRSGLPGDACPPPERSAEPSITSEVVILDPAPPVGYVVKESHDMAVRYLPFLQLGQARAPEATEDLEMSTSPRGDEEKPESSEGSKNASTTSTASDDRVASSSAKAVEKPPPETPTSSNGKAGVEKGDVFTSPLEGIDIDMDAEQSEMQRQIVEMYVRSMQQFSESLAKVKMPIELTGKQEGVVVQKEKQQVKNEGARVFYGSRAFF